MPLLMRIDRWYQKHGGLIRTLLLWTLDRGVGLFCVAFICGVIGFNYLNPNTVIVADKNAYHILSTVEKIPIGILFAGSGVAAIWCGILQLREWRNPQCKDTD